jgi:predicted acyl esterase
MRSLLVSLLALLVLAPAATAAAPSLGTAFEPKPQSQPIYGTDPATKQTTIEAVDGVDLFIETWLPAAKDGATPPAKLPTILIMTPYVQPGVQRYTTRNDANVIEYFTQRGYAVAQHHVRGTGASGGCLEQTAELQIDDGSRVVEYLGKDAPWADGNVGMYGISYDAETQISVAGRGDPARTKYLKAIIPSETVGGQYEYSFMDGVPYTGQALLSNGAYLLTSMEGTGVGPKLAERATCQPDVLSNSGNPTGDMTPYWAVREYRPGAPKFRAATLWLHGFADWNVLPITVSGFFERLPADVPHKGLFGQFDHNFPDKHGSVAQEWERPDWLAMATAWYDRYLKRLDSGVEDWPDVQVQGTDGQWRAEPDFPTTGGPAGQLALSAADGGGTGSLGSPEPQGETSFSEVDGEAVFETATLRAPLHLTGMPIADLWLTSSLPDAHLAGELRVIGADGAELALPGGETVGTFGARSLMHLAPMPEGFFTQTAGAPAPTGTPIRVPLRFQPVDLVVPEGAKLRLRVAGTTSFKRETVPGANSTITLLHGCENPSALRFLTANPQAPLLNVREAEETGPLASTPAPARSTDGGGLATRKVCGKAPERLAAFGPEKGAASGPGLAPRGDCADVDAPITKIARARLSRTRVSLSGTSTDTVCNQVRPVKAVHVIVAQRSGKKCRFLNRRGRLGPRKACKSTLGTPLKARGGARWTFSKRARLVRGTYKVWARGTDALGNVERGRSRAVRVR